MSSSSQLAESWISSFCSLLGHEYFAEVSEDFIEDDFNLTGLQSQVPMYKEALELILDVEPEDDDDDEEEEEEEEEEDDDDGMLLGDEANPRGAAGYNRRGTAADRRHLRMSSDLSMIESSAELLYGLIHQRYITSRPGIQQMLEKYELLHFGQCPRVHCHGAKVLPVGCSDTPGQDTVKLFCPCCLDIYTPPNSRFQTVDGAFFGTTFGCLFFMTFPELEVGAAISTPRTASSSSAILTPSSTAGKPLLPQPTIINGIPPSNLAPGLGKSQNNVYEPRIYGFRVSGRAKSGPRMQWLRDKPVDVNELDEARRFREEHDIKEGDDEGLPVVAGEANAASQEVLSTRKKAAVRKRR
ncbi:casein kinase II beta 1 subunit, partial [Tothia fuscella]